MESPVIELLKQRNASRAIDNSPLEEEVIRQLVEAARLTPSRMNKQPWRFLFLTAKEGLARGGNALEGGNRGWAMAAPLLIVGYSRRDDDCVLDDGRIYHHFDLGMAVMNIMLEATHLGLIARPLAGFNPEIIRGEFALDPEDEPLVMLAVGSPCEDDGHLPEHFQGWEERPRQRKPAEEIVRFL